MRLRAPWLYLASALSSACGLSTVGLHGAVVGEPDDAGEGVDATSSDDVSVPSNDGATDAHHPLDSGHKPDASPDGGVIKDGAAEASATDDGSTDAADAYATDGDTGSSDGGCDGGAGCVIVPSGWTLVAFAPDQGTACPTGFQNPSNLVEGPDTSSVCGCGACTVTSPPSCTSGTINIFYDTVGLGGGGAGTCSTPGMVPTLNNNPAGACGSGNDAYHGSYSPYDILYVPPPASGGTCSAPGAATGSVSFAAHDRACVPASAQAANCAGNECMPDVAAPYAACIMQSGNVACPSGPLSVAHSAGTGLSFGCTACGCSVSAGCTGTITLYTDSKCTKPGVTIPADGSCNRITSLPNSASTYTFNAYVYTGNAPTSPECSASGTSSAENVSLAGAVTICCAH